MDPLSIATSVVGLTATCLSTCKKLHDLAGNYEDVPVVIAMICSESTVISMGLSELQTKILRRHDLSQAWASRTEVWAAFETALTGCMVVFSCLEAETRSLQSKTQGVWAKIKFIWNQDRLKELLSALRGQQSSISFLLKILETETLSDIQQDIRKNAFKIQATASEAQSLRSRNSSIRMEAQSIFDNDMRRFTVFDDEVNPVVAPSELEFEFDDLVLTSQVYRRVLVRAPSEGDQTDVPGEEEVGHSDTATVREVSQELIISPSSDRIAVERPPSRNDLREKFNAIGSTTKENINSHDEQAEMQQQEMYHDEGNVLSLGLVEPPVYELEGDLPNNHFNKADAAHAKWLKWLKRGSADSAQTVKQTCLKSPLVLQRQCAIVHEEQDTTTNGLETPNNQDEPHLKIVSVLGISAPTISRSCFTCGHKIKGSYIATTNRSYHIFHLVCDECDTLLATKTAFCDGEHMVYCYKHFCDKYGERCHGCEFPFYDKCIRTGTFHTNEKSCHVCNYPRSKKHTEITQDGMERKWHADCYSAAENCGLVVPLWLKGHLPTVPLELSITQEQREAHLRDVLQVTSKFLKAFREEVSLVVMSAGPNSALKHWKLTITLAAYLFHITTESLPGGVGKAFIKSFSVAFQKYFTASATSSQSKFPPATEEMIIAAVKPILRVGINSVLTKTSPELVNLLGKIDELVSELSDPQLPILRLLYTNEPTGDEENFKCQKCKGDFPDGAYAESSTLSLMWHSECWQCPVCHRGGSFARFPVLESKGYFKCNWGWCGREGIIEFIPSYAFVIHDMWRVWGHVQTLKSI